MPKKIITPAQRDKIYRDYVGDPEQSIASLGRKYGVHGTTVKKILTAMGVDFAKAAEQRGAVAAALLGEAKETAALRRARMAELLLDDAFRLRERAWAPYSQVLGTKDGPVKVQLELPPIREQHDAYKAIDVALERSRRLIEQDSGEAAGDEVTRWLSSLVNR